MTDLIGIFGTGGFGREIHVLLQRQLEKAGERAEVVFVERTQTKETVRGTRVMVETAFLALSDRARAHIVAIARPDLRKYLDNAAMASGSLPLDVIAPNAEWLGNTEVGAGLVLCSQSVVSVSCRIGRGCHVNFNTYIAHDCIIGEYVTFGPQVACNGNVHVGDGAYIGAGALIRQGTPERPMRIGAGATVGMGAVVTCDVPPGAVVVGNPARPLERAPA